MINKVIDIIKGYEKTTLVNIDDILSELGHTKNGHVVNDNIINMLVEEVNKDLILPLVYTGYKRFYIVVNIKEIHLTSLTVYVAFNYRHFFDLVKSTDRSIYKGLIEMINQLRLKVNKTDTVKTISLRYKLNN